MKSGPAKGRDSAVERTSRYEIEQYARRVADQELRRCLAAAGAVLIEGPRACGKTVTARRMAASEVFLDVDRRAHDMIGVNPALVLEGRTPRLLDEWQTAPVIWNHVRRAVDARPGKGHFILTGSAVPPDDITRHTGAGRIVPVRLRPMSLFEQGYSTGQVSLGKVLERGPGAESFDRLVRARPGRTGLHRRLAGASPILGRRGDAGESKLRRRSLPRRSPAR